MATATTPAAAIFTPEQIVALAAPLDRAHVRSRRQGGSNVSHIEGWVAIAEANRIFGFDGWQRETIELHCVSQADRSFGLALHDKEQRQVSGATGGGAAPLSPATRVTGNSTNGHRPSPAARRESGATQPEPARASSAAVAPDDPALAPLDPPTIQRIHATLRVLPRPVLEGFTKAFRKRFQVPEEAVSMADRITQRRHYDWIEAWLVQHRSVA